MDTFLVLATDRLVAFRQDKSRLLAFPVGIEQQLDEIDRGIRRYEGAIACYCDVMGLPVPDGIPVEYAGRKRRMVRS